MQVGRPCWAVLAAALALAARACLAAHPPTNWKPGDEGEHVLHLNNANFNASAADGRLWVSLQGCDCSLVGLRAGGAACPRAAPACAACKAGGTCHSIPRGPGIPLLLFVHAQALTRRPACCPSCLPLR